jgi:hypothetical protein
MLSCSWVSGISRASGEVSTVGAVMELWKREEIWGGLDMVGKV